MRWLARGARAAGNQLREAQAAGVGHSRRLFSAVTRHADLLGRLQHADIPRDNLRLGSATGIEGALLVDVPAISCVGDTMASRPRGSMLRAASLPECVFSDPQAYVAEAIRLGRNPDALMALRARVQTARTGAALFDLAARVRDWEVAWTVMVERSRPGLAPIAFDVPAPADTSLLPNK